MTGIQIRTEQPGDAGSIGEVTKAAFSKAAHTCGREDWLVEALRAAGALSVSVVAASGSTLVGHAAASPVTLSSGTGAWFGIGPLSVLPECQRQGIGSKLMQAVLADLRARGAFGCVLVGDPAFYGRFGFRCDSALAVPDVPAEFTLSLRFRPSDDRGVVTFHPAFAAALTGP